MKYFVWLIAAFNVYFGCYNFLNVLNILQTSKYSKTATLVYALLFLAMGFAGFYFSIIKHRQKLALLIGIGPWILALVFLFYNMLTGDYK